MQTYTQTDGVKVQTTLYMYKSGKYLKLLHLVEIAYMLVELSNIRRVNDIINQYRRSRADASR